MRCLLQGRLVIHYGQLLVAKLVYFGEFGFEDRLQDEAMCLLQSPIQVQRGDDRLQRIGQQSALTAPTAPILSLAEAQKLSNPERSRRTKQVARAHHVSSQLRQLPFMVFRETSKKFLTDYKRENRVAEKFHLLVVRCRGGTAASGILRLQFTGVGCVSESLFQQVAAAEAMPEGCLQHRKIVKIGLHSWFTWCFCPLGLGSAGLQARVRFNLRAERPYGGRRLPTKGRSTRAWSIQRIC